MKKLFKITLVISLFVCGLSFTGNAGCYTVPITCSDGDGGYALICGDSNDELFEEFADMVDVICN